MEPGRPCGSYPFRPGVPLPAYSPGSKASFTEDVVSPMVAKIAAPAALVTFTAGGDRPVPAKTD
ncbi:hypothetical protein [Amycolatopsis coloradensis]|uniref:hypothetical protein n=1 Tax=Amycolatopsis coloradensis TaxID=76021 RepID=UPI001177877D|nr:hypothetical protein [Amycolatopsis coloradensis]